MNKKELIKAVVEATGFPKKEVTTVVDTVFDKIAEALKNGESVNIAGHGKYEVRERAARKARNLHTGEIVEVPSRKIPTFKPAKSLRDAVK
jgi:DNA-binding protein HU-beta